MQAPVGKALKLFLALPYQWIDFDDFYLADPSKSPSDPDALTSRRGDGSQTLRDGFGSTIFRYTRCMPQAFYDPISGSAKDDAPARALMYTYITRWMRDFRVDGVRMDSVENVANWYFVVVMDQDGTSGTSEAGSRFQVQPELMIASSS